MFRKLLIAAALATATLTAGTAGASAAPISNAIVLEVKQSAGNGGHVQKAGFKHRFKFKRHFFFHHKRHRGGYGGRCHWLKKKAHYTGSRYWWKKYKRCMYRYYW